MRPTERKCLLKYFLSNDPPATLVDGQIDDVLSEMQTQGVTSEEYPKLLRYLEQLNDMRKDERRPPLSIDTIVTVAGNLLGILLIVAYEQKHVMTSKGLSQLIRPKT